jgi:hypothetical protein
MSVDGLVPGDVSQALTSIGFVPLASKRYRPSPRLVSRSALST